MRFPFQHPAQAAVGMELAREGRKRVDEYYAGHNGMVPEWLSGYAPYGGGRLFETGLLNPGETLGSLVQSIPGLTKGQTESLSSQESPAFGMLQELISGQSRYGQAYRGNERITGPLGELAGRFGPYSTLKSLTTSKKGGGTFQQGVIPGLKQFFSIPTTKLNNPSQTAALGMKDYEQALSMPDEIKFRHDYSLQQLPRELKHYARVNGSPLDNNSLSMLRHDIDNVETRDMYQTHFAGAHGARSFKSLPAIDKAKAGIAFNLQYKYFTPQQAQEYSAALGTVHNESDMTKAADMIWRANDIGKAATKWKAMVKQMQANPVLASRG